MNNRPKGYPTFRSSAATIAANGYLVVPLYPGKKYPLIEEDWPKYRYTPGDEQKYLAEAGIGIITGQVVGVDIDVCDEVIAQQIAAEFERVLGVAPQRIGAAPKALYLYRVAGPSFAKRQTQVYRLPNDPPPDEPGYKGHKVEILAEGQQFVAFGIHPNTNQAYHWNGRGDPSTVHAAKLPTISDRQAFDLLAKAEKILQALGTPFGRLSQQETGRKHQPNEKLLADDSEQLRAALQFIPNEELSFDDWTLVGLAIKGALGEDGRQDFLDWSARAAKSDPRESERAWKSFKPRSGAGSIFHRAAQNGWRRPVAATAEGDWDGVDERIVPDLNDLRPDELVLPSDYVPVPPAAKRIFAHFATRHELFTRAGGVVELDSKTNALTPISSDAFRARLDRQRRRTKTVVVHRGEQLMLKQKRCSADMANVLLASKEAFEELPAISMVTRSAVLVEHEGKLLTLGPGYHSEGDGILVLGMIEPPNVPLSEAVSSILALVNDFKFATPADRPRAIANFIGPGIRMSGALTGFATMNTVEANASQTGKGYLLECQRAVYDEPGVTITKKDGGVGSLDESIGAALFTGKPFITFDNVKGLVNSQYLESTLTNRNGVRVRVPYRGEVTIDPKRTTLHLTSNGFEATVDLGNRSLITRLEKQPEGFRFTEFAAGDLLAHIESNQAYFLGCVFAVIRDWYARGKPKLPTTHSFREWVGTLDWIVQNIFKLNPLLDGHSDAVTRVTSPGLSWLRALAVQVIKEGRGGMALQAGALVQLSADAEIPIPGVSADASDEVRTRRIGVLMQGCFKEKNELQLDSITVTRTVNSEYVPAHQQHFDIKRYTFRRPAAGADGEIGEM
jgi:hypothetical protein